VVRRPSEEKRKAMDKWSEPRGGASGQKSAAAPAGTNLNRRRSLRSVVSRLSLFARHGISRTWKAHLPDRDHPNAPATLPRACLKLLLYL
jgi:hypothetical protein